MNTLKDIVISLIFSAVAVGLCELLIPKNSFKNQMRMITGAVLLISMISPFLSGFIMPVFDFSDFSVDYSAEENAERSVAYAAKNEIADIILKNGVNKAKITVNTGFDENKSIIIDSVIILFDKKDKAKIKTVAAEIKDKLKVKTEVGEL